MSVMIRQCNDRDFETIYSIINDAAKAYRGVIPEDRWKEPYMPREELQHEIDEGVVFWGYEADGELIGVAGIQHVQDVTLIRQAYIHPTYQRQGIGSKLQKHLAMQAKNLYSWEQGQGQGQIGPRIFSKNIFYYWYPE